MKKAFYFSLTVLLGMLLALTSPSIAQWEEIPHDDFTLDFGGASSDDSTSIQLTAAKGVEWGWVGIHQNFLSVENEIEDQVSKAHAQGGVDWFGFRIEAFADVESNKEKGAGLISQVGGMFRKIATLDDLTLALSFGNYAENTQFRDDLGLAATDPVTLSRWLLSTTAKYNFNDRIGLYANGKFTPESRFKDLQGSLEIGVDVAYSRDVSFGVKALWDFHNNSPTGETVTREIYALARIQR